MIVKLQNMNIEARKYQLIERVMMFNEDELKKIEDFLKSESALSDSLDRALKQVENGQSTPHSEVRKKYEKWL